MVKYHMPLRNISFYSMWEEKKVLKRKAAGQVKFWIFVGVTPGPCLFRSSYQLIIYFLFIYPDLIQIQIIEKFNFETFDYFIILWTCFLRSFFSYAFCCFLGQNWVTSNQPLKFPIEKILVLFSDEEFREEFQIPRGIPRGLIIL